MGSLVIVFLLWVRTNGGTGLVFCPDQSFQAREFEVTKLDQIYREAFEVGERAVR